MAKISLTIKGETYQAVLFNGPLADTFIKKIPVTIKMKELNGNEKYYNFTESFPVKNEKVGSIEVGDLMFFGSDTFVLFYNDFPTSYSYTKLGKIDNTRGLDKLLGTGNIDVSIELVE